MAGRIGRSLRKACQPAPAVPRIPYIRRRFARFPEAAVLRAASRKSPPLFVRLARGGAVSRQRTACGAGGNLRPADLAYLSFSFDLRVLHGAVGAVFGNAVIRHLQNPASLLLPERLGG